MTKNVNDGINRQKIFLISVIALFTSGLSAALRASIAGDIQGNYLDAIDLASSTIMIGEILGISFLGFAFSLFFSSPLLDAIGMSRLLMLSAVCFIGGTLIVIFADAFAVGSDIYWYLWGGMLISGIGWGLVEGTTNPLTTSLYPEDKTNRLNILHAWWPAGLVVGGLSGVALSAFDLSWKVQFSLVLLPSLVYAYMVFGMKFPLTERAAAGVSMKEMLTEITRQPSFFVWLGAMILTAASELAPGQLVDLVLTRTVGMDGILLLVYVSGLMFVMRHFSGVLLRFISPVGLLWCSCALAAAGLYLLSFANSPLTGFLAATIWGIGVCYMWPTMLATASERYPRGGSFFIGLMGAAGALSINFVLPELGGIFDQAKQDFAGGIQAFSLLEGESLNAALISAARTTFQSIALFPLSLLFVFGAIWYRERLKGGYSPVLVTSKELSK
ncbi:MFS transporter [Thalassotalea fonticola]|uniref:MFS transporter n=1 Tax=Thalassotalea fonticola TaxID=3065649 RepID=A0ABZ0GK49_9GAMM|nr:MFS transporter [Colwelliaceae bacterium S1-1]